MNRTDVRFDSDDFTLEQARDAVDDDQIDTVRLDREIVDWGGSRTLASERRRDDVTGLGALLFANDHNDHIEKAILYDADTGLYAVVSGHKRSEAMNQAEYDLKVHSVGSRLDADLIDGDFETDGDRVGWLEYLVGDVIDYGDADGIHSVKPASEGFAITITDRDIGGLKGDRFDVSLTATEG